MININIYNNGVKIDGHAEPIICYQVSIAMFERKTIQELK